ncbi:biogenesis of lysosome-related organelles complex 1 subunit 6 [Euwallacea fornicatus]|uniref:biogenesis of lysosome-related organelles complex 1 subunit 6 n=1 Tax=Euwallacea fornicatus TaxID=995702 RepID=UPI00338EE93D
MEAPIDPQNPSSSRSNSETLGNIYLQSAQIFGVGLVNLLEPPLKDSKSRLTELQAKQQELVERLHHENLSISEVQYSPELQALFVKIKFYHGKLQGIKKDMKGVRERCQRLKKRALRLQEIKQWKPQEEVIVSKASNVISVKPQSSSSNV